MDQAHEQIAHLRAVQGAIEQCVFDVKLRASRLSATLLSTDPACEDNVKAGQCAADTRFAWPDRSSAPSFARLTALQPGVQYPSPPAALLMEPQALVRRQTELTAPRHRGHTLTSSSST